MRRSGQGGSGWVLSCEHGSFALPREYGTLGLAGEDLRDHIGWDIGAAPVMRRVCAQLGAPGVSSRFSRLLVDCNRAPEDATLIPPVSDGRSIPGNALVSAAERRRRLAEFYDPYHARVDRMVERALRLTTERRPRLLSVHSFTPEMEGQTRPFDLGVLFDDHPALARAFGRALESCGFQVRYNEPYSGIDGLIYSAQRHGRAHEIPYVELEINNALIRTEEGCHRIADGIVTALRRMELA